MPRPSFNASFAPSHCMAMFGELLNSRYVAAREGTATRRRQATMSAAFMGRPPGLAEPLFMPRIGVVVVSALFPEAGAVFRNELDGAHPLGALPEVAARHDEAHRSAMIRL